jgi:hypothetical protein
MLLSAIDKHYKTHDSSRISQGDILRDFEFIIGGQGHSTIQIEFQYIIVLSQDCDLTWGNEFFSRDMKKPFNQYLHNILLTPAFPAELVRGGEHLTELYGFNSSRITSANWKLIKQNSNSRYHYLPADIDLQIPDLLIDFKAYYTIPFSYILELYSVSYHATINELFRESLSQRFAYFLTRIALPELNASSA